MEDMPEPWRKDTNQRYSEVVRSVMALATASLLLPVFLAREFLGISHEIPLLAVLDFKAYFAWLFLATSIVSGVAFMYLSAKWMRLAWGKKAGILCLRDTKESTVERWMEVFFWASILAFVAGIVMTVVFFTTTASGV